MMTSTHFSISDKWRWLCLGLAWVATAALVAAPLIEIASFLFPDAMPFPVKVREVLVVTSAIPFPSRLGMLACDFVSTGFGMWLLWSLQQLLLGFTRGEIFTAGALRHLHYIALALLLGTITDILALAPESFIATWRNGPGHREISVGLGGGDFTSLFLVGVAFVIAGVMAEAGSIAADNAEIV